MFLKSDLPKASQDLLAVLSFWDQIKLHDPSPLIFCRHTKDYKSVVWLMINIFFAVGHSYQVRWRCLFEREESGRSKSDFKFRLQDDIVYVLNLSQTEISKSIMGRQLQGWVKEFGGIQEEDFANWPFISKSITVNYRLSKNTGGVLRVKWGIKFSRVQMNENNNSHKTSRWLLTNLLRQSYYSIRTNPLSYIPWIHFLIRWY